MRGKVKSTHSHSKVVGMKGDGYRHLNKSLASHTDRVSRPDIAYSTGDGRHGVDNSTIKNDA